MALEKFGSLNRLKSTKIEMEKDIKETLSNIRGSLSSIEWSLNVVAAAIILLIIYAIVKDSNYNIKCIEGHKYIFHGPFYNKKIIRALDDRGRPAKCEPEKGEKE